MAAVGKSLEAPFGCYSLLAYLPDYLSDFLNPLRAALVPGCRSRTHISLLAPRPLRAPAEETCRELATTLSEMRPVEISLGRVSAFLFTGVVYLSVDSGFEDVVEIYGRVNSGSAQFTDAHVFHPHVTLAQGLSPHALEKAYQSASTAWDRYTGSRAFTIDQLHLVHCHPNGEFIDAAEFMLFRPAAVGQAFAPVLS